MMNKLIRITTVPLSLEKLLEGQLNFMQKEYQVIAVSADEQRLRKLGDELGVDTFSVEMTREITPIRDFAAVWKLYKFFKKEKPLIVHTHTPKAGITGMLAAKMSGVPLRLHTVAGLPLLEAKGAKRKLLEYVERMTFACATQIYPNSFKIHDYLIRNNYAPKKKLKVIGKGSSNGIDTRYFDPELYSAKETKKFRSSMNIPEDDLVFIFVGRLVNDKGINELVKAFQKLNSNFHSSTLLLVGPFEAELDPLHKTTISVIRNHPKIVEVGYQNDVRPFLACSDVLAFPSYREGFPNVVMQAGAMDLPSIVTDINGCNEIIKNGVNGIIVPVRSVSDLYEAMKKVMVDSGYHKFLKRNSRKIICENYEREEMWDCLLKEYKIQERELKRTNE